MEEESMTSNRAASLIGAFIFLCIAALALYRLMVGFPITIGGMEIGQTSSFLVFVICAGLSVALFRGQRQSS
jgi:hypothetical protein